jgi:hypothetical protein
MASPLSDPAVVQLERGRAGSKLPGGVQACDVGAWSVDTDRHGLNVRAEPSVRSRILGTLPPPFRFTAASEAAPNEGYRTEFRIVGFKDGWFLIEGATPPGKRYLDDGEYPRRHPHPFAGRGFVPAGMVGAQYANGGTRMGGLFAKPREDAPWMPAKNEAGDPISVDGGPKRILGCSGSWAHVESHDGVRGWWRGLCSNQVTNCS